MSDKEIHASKRRRTEHNPFLDLEAAAGDEEESDDEEFDESGAFIVDDTTEDGDILGSNVSMHPIFSTEEQDLQLRYEAFLARARKRARFENDAAPVLPWVQNRLLGISVDHEEGTATWVRIRRIKGALSIYVGDLVLAISTEQPQIYEFWIIPQPRLIKERRDVRAMQMLFNPALAQAEYRLARITQETDSRVNFHFKGNSYSANGFLIIRAPPTLAAVFGGQVLPTRRELDLFSTCEALDHTFRALTEDRMAQNAIIVGDRVKGIAGTLQGLTGIVQDESEDTVTVHIASLDILESVMRFEVRKEFRVGDRVVFSKEGQRDEHGWIVEIHGNKLVVLDLYHNVEITYSSEELSFDDEIHHLVDLRNLSPLSYEDRRAMRENPNHRFIGKSVTVVGAHRRKGVTGTIKDVTLDNHAFVAINVFNCPGQEKFPFAFLRLTLQDHSVGINALPGNAADPLPPKPCYSFDLFSTPMPTKSTHTGDAWDPSSRTPDLHHANALTSLDSSRDAGLQTPQWSPLEGSLSSDEGTGWLVYPEMQGLRFHLKTQQVPNKTFEFRAISDGIVKVRDGAESRMFPLAEVSTCTPTRKQDIVVCFSQGENFGQLFCIKTFGQDKCILRKFGVPKTTKIEKLYTLATLTLAVVYPPKK